MPSGTQHQPEGYEIIGSFELQPEGIDHRELASTRMIYKLQLQITIPIQLIRK